MSEEGKEVEPEEIPIPTIEEQACKMLTENTGSHFLDSGGAYGRNHERNRGKSVADFEFEPPITVGEYGITVSLFHWIKETLAIEPGIHRLWIHFLELLDNLEEGEVLEGAIGSNGDPLDSDYYWHDLRTGFVSWLESHGFEVESSGGDNSENSENFLSQAVQWDRIEINSVPEEFEERFELGDWHYSIILLQVHGGCDIRGGYTAPYPFSDEYAEEFAFLDFANVEVCWHPVDKPDTGQEVFPGFEPPIPPENIYLSSYTGGYSFYNESGEDFPSDFPFEVNDSSEIGFQIIDTEGKTAEEVQEEIRVFEDSRLSKDWTAKKPVIYLERLQRPEETRLLRFYPGTIPVGVHRSDSPNGFRVIGHHSEVWFEARSLQG